MNYTSHSPTIVATMSKLIEKLKEVTNGPTQALGFRATQAPAMPKMLLILSIPVKGASGAEVKDADAVMLEMADGVKETKQVKTVAHSFGSTSWGIRAEKITREEARKLKEDGCDFVVLPASGMPLGAVKEGELGRVIAVPLDLERGLAAALDDMPLDAVFVEIQEHALNLHSLMSVRRLTAVLDKPVLGEVTPGISADELEALRDAGLAGVVISPGAEGAERIKELLQAVKNLPVRKKKQPTKKSALLPSIGQTAEETPEEEDEGDE